MKLSSMCRHKTPLALRLDFDPFQHVTCRCLLFGGLLAASFGAPLAPTATAKVLVRFQHDDYVVAGPDFTFPVNVIVDADDSTPEIDNLAGGLFSFGVRLLFNDGDAAVTSAGDITAASQLNHFGFQTGALRNVGPSFGEVKGNIDQTANPLVPYDGSVLAQFDVKNLAPQSAVYLLSLDFFNTLGPTEQIFLDGNGVVLDQEIVFGEATVTVSGPSADFNQDGVIDDVDYGIWQANFGLENRTPDQGDADLDTDADGRDYLFWQAQRGGSSLAGPAGRQVPEPSALLLTALTAGLCLWSRPRKRGLMNRSRCPSAGTR